MKHIRSLTAGGAARLGMREAAASLRSRSGRASTTPTKPRFPACPKSIASEPHDNEVFAVFDYTETDTFPGSDAMNAAATDLCIAQFQDYVGVAYTDSPLEVFPITPTEASWESGDREVICSLYNSDFSKLTGSMRGWRQPEVSPREPRCRLPQTPPVTLKLARIRSSASKSRSSLAWTWTTIRILPLGWTGRHDHIGRQGVAAFVEEVVGTGVGRVLIWIPSVVDAYVLERREIVVEEFFFRGRRGPIGRRAEDHARRVPGFLEIRSGWKRPGHR